MKKRVLAVIFLIVICFGLNAQTDSVYYGTKSKDTTYRPPRKKPNNDWMKKITYGSNVQATFGTYTYIYVSPTIGYMLTKNLNIGVGFIYSYVSINYSGYGKVSQSIFGAHSYARYFVTDNFFIQGQFDHLKQPDVYNYYNPESKVWVDYALVGGGYRQLIGKRAALITSIMINVTPNRLSIYSNPVFQVGFVGGF